MPAEKFSMWARQIELGIPAAVHICPRCNDELVSGVDEEGHARRCGRCQATAGEEQELGLTPRLLLALVLVLAMIAIAGKA